MRVLVTRPREESAELAAALAARGIASLVEPLLEIRPLPDKALSLAGVQALLFTSANGVRAFAALKPRRDLAVLAVGERTAEVARTLGFTRVESARGAVAELAELARTRLDPTQGSLLHPAGAAVKGDLVALLAPHGFVVRREALYEAVASTALSPAAVAALEAGTLDAVMLFSPRSAETFVSLAKAAGLAGACARLTALCLSPAVAAAARSLPWRAVRSAERPEQSVLLALLPPLDNGAEAVDANDDKSPATTGASAPPASDPKPAKENEAEAARKRRVRSLVAGIAAVGAVAIVIAAAIGANYWRNGGPSGTAPTAAGPTNASDAALAARLGELERRIAALPQSGPAPAAKDTALADAVTAQGKKLGALERALGDLAARPEAGAADAAKLAALADQVAALKDGTATLAERVSALSDRSSALADQVAALKDDKDKLARDTAAMRQRLAALEALVQRAAEADPRGPALVLAVGQLREALSRSGPYDKALAAVAALVPGDAATAPPLAALQARAATGVPTREVLASRFDQVSLTAAQAVIAPEQPSLIGETIARLSRLVVIRRTDDTGDGGPLALLARGESALKAGDLAGAVAALGKLDGAPAAAVKSWLADARARLAAEDALAALSAAAIARLDESRK